MCLLIGHAGCWIFLGPDARRGPADPAIADFVGTYHLDLERDAVNLLIRADGSVVWDWCICDSHTLGYADLRAAGGGFELTCRRNCFDGELRFPTTPPEGEEGRGDVTTVTVASVDIRRGEDGLVRTTIDDVTLEWLPGRVCPVCQDYFNVATEACDCFSCPGAPPIHGVPGCEE